MLTTLSAVLLAGCSSLTGSPEVQVSAGRLIGSNIDGISAFRGIPYAAPPTGELRWRSPRPVAAWEGVRAAQAYAPHCAQAMSEFAGFEQKPMSEDCLTVNVWTPDLQPKLPLPVMVWIHGGGYSLGSGNKARTNSPTFARQGVVLVTLNYRLSIFGFMSHPAFAQPDEPSGNYGLQDVVAALQWVQDNVAAFGGDPSRVTIFGESAGAGIVNTLLVMPSAAGLFQQAISESSSVGLAPDPYPAKRAGFLPPSEKMGLEFAKKMGLANDASPEVVVGALRAANTDELLAVITDRDRYTPVIDGKLFPDQVGALLAAGKAHPVAYMTGGNSWEASLGRDIGGGFSPEFSARLLTQEQKNSLYAGMQGETLEDAIFGDLVVHSSSNYVATQLSNAGMPVYRYYLSYLAEARRGVQPGVAHEDDIAFVMQTLETEPDLTTVSDKDREVSQLLSNYWVQFAKTGVPGPEWPAFSAAKPLTLEIGDNVEVREGLFSNRLEFHTERGRTMMERARN